MTDPQHASLSKSFWRSRWYSLNSIDVLTNVATEAILKFSGVKP